MAGLLRAKAHCEIPVPSENRVQIRSAEAWNRSGDPRRIPKHAQRLHAQIDAPRTRDLTQARFPVARAMPDIFYFARRSKRRRGLPAPAKLPFPCLLYTSP